MRSLIHPRFVGLEGCDGAGKTTLRQRIARNLKCSGSRLLEVGQHAWLDPLASRIMLDVREQRARYHPEIVAEAYRRDKSLHERVNIRPFLTGGIVLADRTIISDAVYQEALYEIDACRSIERYVADGYLFPGLVVHVTIDVVTAVQRIAQRGKHRRHYERAVELNRIRDIYLRVLPLCERLTGTRVIVFENRTGELEARYEALLQPALAVLPQPTTLMGAD